MEPDPEWASLPGPIGVKYDDNLTITQIHLVVLGIRPKSFVRAANTDVHLKYDEDGFVILLEIFKMNKKLKPPRKNILDRRYFELRKCPGKILSCEYKLMKDQCVLTLRKALPSLWSNALSS